MKSRRIIFLLLGLLAIFITGFGIKAAISNSDNHSSEVSYSISNTEDSQSSIKKESSSKKKKINEQTTDAMPSETSSAQAKKESQVNEENTISSDKNAEVVVEEPEQEENNHPSLQSEQMPPKLSQQPKKEEEKPNEPPASEPSKQIEEESSVNQPITPPVSISEEVPKETPEEEVPVATVMVSVTSDSSVKGTILGDTAVEYHEGDTALDVTIRILKQKGIQFGVSGAGSSAYVQGIDNLYEFDEGPMSGWQIRLNGVMIDRSAGAYPLSPGDSVNWNYTTNYLEG